MDSAQHFHVHSFLCMACAVNVCKCCHFFVGVRLHFKQVNCHDHCKKKNLFSKPMFKLFLNDSEKMKFFE